VSAKNVPVPATSPQIGRIARLLRIDPTELQGLDDVPDADLRAFHDQISKTIFAEGQQRFARVAGLARTIPGPLAGVLAEKFLPPVMAARVSENLDPAKARDLIGRVSIKYLAEIALALDPVRSKPVVQKLPPEPIGKVAKELFGRKEYATMAEFVGTVTVEALFAALHVATPHDLLAVVPLLEWNDNLDRVIAELPDKQVADIAASLTAEELAELALALDPSRMGPIVAAVPVETVAGIAAELFGRREYAGMAAFVGIVTPEMMHAALGVASGHDLLAIVPLLEWNENLDTVIEQLKPAQVNAIVTELDTGELAELAMVLDPGRMGPIVSAVPVGTVADIARVLFDRDEYAAMARFVGVVTEPMLHAALGVASAADLLAVVPLLEWSKQIDGVVEALPDATLDGLFAEIAGGSDWAAAKVAFERLSPTAQQRLFARFERLSKANQQKVRTAAEAGELGPAASALMAGAPA
jgi:flagellar motility protein MotE (MotC chaperone)